MQKILLVTGSLIFLALGTLHLLYTFFSTKFLPRDPTVEVAMKGTSPRLTKETTMWRAWIGFNASHSTGAMLFGIVILILTTAYFQVLQESVAIQMVILINSLFYLFLAKRYWFRIPFWGMFVSCLCFLLALTLFYIP